MTIREVERRRQGEGERYDPDLRKVMLWPVFLQRNKLSKTQGWRLRKVGLGPKTVPLGVRRLGVTYGAEKEWQENSPIQRENVDRHVLSGEAWHAARRKKRKRRAQAQSSAESGTSA
jgi:hypothetical protein